MPVAEPNIGEKRDILIAAVALFVRDPETDSAPACAHAKSS